eukprot:546263-Rhodomonas_salina.12
MEQQISIQDLGLRGEATDLNARSWTRRLLKKYNPFNDCKFNLDDDRLKLGECLIEWALRRLRVTVGQAARAPRHCQAILKAAGDLGGDRELDCEA